jgi:quinoprotein glucose dehydrogenase
METVRLLKDGSWNSYLASVAKGGNYTSKVRSKALTVLAEQKFPEMPDLLKQTIEDSDSGVRIASAGLLGATDPVRAVKGLAVVLQQGSPEDKQRAFLALDGIAGAEADRLLQDQLLLLAQGKIPTLAQLDLLEVAGKRTDPGIVAALGKYQGSLSKSDPLAIYAACLEGGDAVNGKRLYNEHPVAACKRCHTINKSGGEAGPPLDAIGARFDNRYLLESIVEPNAKIAETFRMVVCTLKSGAVKTGVLRQESPEAITIQLPGEEAEVIPVAEIASREAVPSGMMPGLGLLLTKRELRDLVAYLASLKEELK